MLVASTPAPDGLVLLLEGHGQLFSALLHGRGGAGRARAVTPGSRLRVTGVYRAPAGADVDRACDVPKCCVPDARR